MPMVSKPRLSSFLIVVLLSANIQAQDRESLDVSLFRSINGQQSEQDGFFEYLDKVSIPAFIITPAVFLVAGAADDRSAFDSGLEMIASELVALGGTGLMKMLVSRPRPFEALDGVRAKHLSSAVGSSFPSGHASTAAALATTLILRHPRATVIIPSILVAGAIGFGRVYLGVHYPSDVVAGFAVGIVSAVVVHLFEADFRNLSDRLLGRRPAPYSPPVIGRTMLRIPFNF
jgi:membrane-associated phospholipid phosphatase